jgi:hypothetical protein
MKAIIRFSLAVTILAVVSSCQKSGERTSPTKEPTSKTSEKNQESKNSAPKHTGKGRVYKKKYGFSIVPPKGWAKTDHPEGGAFLVYEGPKVDGLPPNLDVRSVPDNGTPIEKWGAPLKRLYASKFEKWKLADEGFMTIDGKRAYFISSRYLRQEGNQKIPIQQIQYCVPGNNKKLYILTFTTIPKHFDELRKAFDKATQSVQTD